MLKTNMKTEPKILIVENDRYLANACKIKFEYEKFKVIVALDDKEGLKKMIKEKPDIVLLDIVMPKMCGFKLLKSKNKISVICDIPVIIFSNLGQDEEIEKGMKLGAKKFIVKTNLSIGELVQDVKRYMQRNK